MAHRNRSPRLRTPSSRLLLSALALAIGPLGAQAITLGRFQTLSGIGEPLRAEIEIAAMTDLQAQGLRAQLAPARAFQQQGMEFNPALEGLTTTIENRPGGRSVIVLQGRKPVQDNFIDLILETQWATGRTVRNYAVLLSNIAEAPRQEPARAQSMPVPSPASPPPAEPARVEFNAQRVPVYRFDTPDDSRAPSSTPPAALQAPAVTKDPWAAPAPARSATPDASITVEPGQTASGLALAHMPAAVTLDQMLIALLRENPHAFIQENVNLVRAGATLRLPNAEQARQISPEQARTLVLAQQREFAEYAHRVAQNPLQMGQQENRETSGKLTDRGSQQPARGAPQDTLKLSKPDSTPNSAEAKLAAQQQAREASAQIDSLQKNLADLNSLMSASEASPANAPAWSALDTGNRAVWLWAAALAALLGLGLWWRNRRPSGEPMFAPSYDDEPTTFEPVEKAKTDPIPPQMASIDLELPTHPARPVQPAQGSTAASDPNTQTAKLDLAAVLISKGDVVIARALIESVLASSSAEHKARALQMLSQLP